MINSNYIFFKVIRALAVVILFSSCEEVLLETDISEEEVILLAPQDGSNLSFTSVNFNWSSVTDANQYNFQLATPNFSNANQIIEDVVLDSITQFSTTLTINDYEWRVRALNEGYSTNYTSAQFSILDNVNFQDNTVIITNPSGDIITNTSQQLFQWSTIQDATGYRIQIINNTNSTVIEEELLVEAEFAYTFGDGDYTFQIRAEKNQEVTLYTEISVFIDTVVPNVPELISPLDETLITGDVVVFEWIRDVSTGATEFDKVFIYDDEALTSLVKEERATSPYETAIDNGIFYWLVKGYDEAGNESASSSVFSFTKN